ncbi:hypothetical protein HHL19_35275 [Streptomyces sp. R302]|uniref:hypothetical protein n=1 Tax=unclassified Streptomyces TaxID=2593676 RepID=UPI00145CFE36|nr:MULTISPECIES: hypothetical protein [unclassified Streptomyces]NML55196.1 hypothetical protein [Streptomyces sp. R301]NML83774.1 hypothetical protein [Streptomyces sp. R302]
MTTPQAAQAAPKLSDRARLALIALGLHEDGEWVDYPSLCARLDMNSHEVRRAVADLCAAGIVQRRRRYGRTPDRRRTNLTFFRLTADTSQVSA